MSNISSGTNTIRKATVHRAKPMKSTTALPFFSSAAGAPAEPSREYLCFILISYYSARRKSTLLCETDVDGAPAARDRRFCLWERQGRKTSSASAHPAFRGGQREREHVALAE